MHLTGSIPQEICSPKTILEKVIFTPKTGVEFSQGLDGLLGWFPGGEEIA